jgi:colanic acid/amylovoran biosynthesis glycosyltransferase
LRLRRRLPPCDRASRPASPAIPELIRDGGDGLLVAPSDLEGLVEALKALIDDPGLCRRLGASGRQRVIADFDLATNVDHLAQQFRTRVEV